MTDDLVKQLRAYAACQISASVGEHEDICTQAADAIDRLSADYKTCSGKFWDLQQRYADVNNQFTEAQSTIDRLTAERDAEWHAGATAMREACATEAYQFVDDPDDMQEIRARIRALSPSTLNKPE